jgi:hypothetical protein
MEKSIEKIKRQLTTISQKNKLILLVVITILIVSSLSGCQGIDEEKSSGKYEVGAEWVGDYSQVGKPPLPHTEANAEGFFNEVAVYDEWDQSFIRGNADARERHFKKMDMGGFDFAWADSVDFLYFAGHGCAATPYGTGSCFTFGVDAYDDWILEAWLMNKEPKWGDQDLEWIVLDCCSALANKTGGMAAYPLEARWMNSEVMHGLHFIFGFATAAIDNEFRGGIFGRNIVCPDCHQLIEGWRRATIYTNENWVDGAYLYAYSPGNNPHEEWLPPGWTSGDPDPAQQSYGYATWSCG